MEKMKKHRHKYEYLFFDTAQGLFGHIYRIYGWACKCGKSNVLAEKKS